jgi:hypothetical protein
MALKRDVTVGGFPVWVEHKKPLVTEVIEHLDDSFENRLGTVFTAKKLHFNLRSVVKCPKTEKKERKYGRSKSHNLYPKIQNSDNCEDECEDEYEDEYEEDNLPLEQNHKTYKKFNKRGNTYNALRDKKKRGWLAKSPRREGMWK